MKSGRPTTVTPFLVVKNAAKAIEFYKAAFEALVLERYDLPDGRVNAKIAIGVPNYGLGMQNLNLTT